MSRQTDSGIEVWLRSARDPFRKLATGFEKGTDMIKTRIASTAAVFTFGLAALGGAVVAIAGPANAGTGLTSSSDASSTSSPSGTTSTSDTSSLSGTRTASGISGSGGGGAGHGGAIFNHQG